MKKNHDSITLYVAGRRLFVAQSTAVALLGVHPKTAQRWASGPTIAKDS